MGADSNHGEGETRRTTAKTTPAMSRSTVGALVRRFGADRSGNFFVLFATSVILLLGGVGLAVDFGMASMRREQMLFAAETAALAGAGRAKEYYRANADAPGAAKNAEKKGVEYAEAVYASNIAKASSVAPKATFSVTYDKGTFTGKVDVKAVYETTFLSVLGTFDAPIKTTAAAAVSIPAYRQMHLLLDISQSMGLAATEADEKKLWEKTEKYGTEGCTFGCHATSPAKAGIPSNSAIAKEYGITLRIDSLRKAVLNLFKLAESSGHGDAYKFSLTSSAAVMTSMSVTTNNYADLNKAAAKITLGPTNYQGPGDSYWPWHMETLAKNVPTGGDGTSPGKAAQYVVLVTDGVWDTVPVSGQWCISGHCTGTLTSAVCKDLKKKNVEVAVIYTTYLPIYKTAASPSSGYNVNYKDLVLPFAPKIKDSLKACASPGLFFEASDGPAIDVAFRALFDYSSMLRVTN